MSSKTDPYTSYRFTVEIDSLIVGGFSEITGLEREVETEDYNEGGVNRFTRSFPDRTTYPNLTMERGLTDSGTFWNWIQQIEYGIVERKNGRILLLDSSNREVWGWEFRDAYPVKWSGPELRANEGSIAFESLELTHQGLSKVEGVP